MYYITMRLYLRLLDALPGARLVVKVDIGQVNGTRAQDVPVVLLDVHVLARAFNVPTPCQRHMRYRMEQHSLVEVAPIRKPRRDESIRNVLEQRRRQIVALNAVSLAFRASAVPRLFKHTNPAISHSPSLDTLTVRLRRDDEEEIAVGHRRKKRYSGCEDGLHLERAYDIFCL
jgi:hypothetical protein